MYNTTTNLYVIEGPEKLKLTIEGNDCTVDIVRKTFHSLMDFYLTGYYEGYHEGYSK